MQTQSITAYLGKKSYPGRTLALAVSPDGKTATITYFIMGRSANSQNRIFVQDGDLVRTQAFDEAKVEDPRLIIYPVYRRFANMHIVTNGDQTETIYQGLGAGKHPVDALLERECEPDAPNFTPRISLITTESGYELNLIKAAQPDGETSVHFDYKFPYLPGSGHCIHTYGDDGDPLPSYSGEPTAFAYIENMGEQIWQAINSEYKISLLECVLDLETHEMKSMKIWNKHMER
ncbi:IMP cyclohydrolase [Arcanobacterium hippocoleae]|uniref:IMP cyclohydrolase n=1 Tax=Arcanobacterium hippocoleae TaxID=149017 RepID=A0ABU1T0E5_9ACTO|nr:IMP cyclohydrolase [Arcanobacterium hippocoleae]MDR6938842.1 IMP cyclohydrolase [Arcanobacterium hippocoleae]